MASPTAARGGVLAALTGAGGRALAWLEMYRHFLVLYLDFTGYSDIAIGSGLLFGIRIPENFRWPLVSTSIQEFWQRWHLSLGAFIGTYLFKPIVRQTGKPALGIFLAFLFVGLWHNVSIPYLIWGFGHGAALAITMMLRKAGAFKTTSALAARAMQLGGWLFTISFVSFMSSFANQGSLEGPVLFIRSLILN
ncbi:MBOAT family O-acyltransferase [Pseudooceanicola sp. 200-1SW]|uniref:MBOAT family O-acyltransferase n=1 Tax=Pseudooceanicola sp. 200-1SW TaxID=3425949 RepID=UPI003D7F3F8B